jgi:hypothetical protein
MINPVLVNNKLNLKAKDEKKAVKSIDNKLNTWIRVNGEWVRNK